MRKAVIVISDDEELRKALRRALKAAEGITVFTFSEESLKNKNRVILIAMFAEGINDIFYGRIRSRYLNPVLVLGFDAEEPFCKGFPLFNDHPYNHNYLRIPFGLLQFIDSLKQIIPISSQAIREAICGGDKGYKGYLSKLLRHDLLKDREKCLQILSMAKVYLNDRKLFLEIESATKTIRDEINWSAKASEIGNELQNKLKDL
jgi:hypothetical protein